MQVNYRTISSYEYDSVSGVFKEVDKEVEDTSGSNSSFMDMLSGVEQEESDMSVEQSNSNNSSANSTNQSPYANMSSAYAYRFRQNEEETSLKAQQTNQKDSMLSELLGTI